MADCFRVAAHPSGSDPARDDAMPNKSRRPLARFEGPASAWARNQLISQLLVRSGR